MAAVHLRPSQQAIVAYSGGYLGVAAVPGSGKTTTLAALACELIATQLQPDQQVLVVTYQNSAVDNVRQRILAGLTERGLWPTGFEVRTLHSLAYGILREHPDLAGATFDFAIADEPTAGRLLEEACQLWQEQHPTLMADWGMEEAVRQKWPDTLRNLAKVTIRTAKHESLSPQAVAARLPQASEFLRIGQGVYQIYQQRLQTNGALDFDDLAARAVALLQQSPYVAEQLRARWPFILEDEAQDSTPLQERLLGLIAGEPGNWVRVGDPNQAILSTFTASDPRFLRRFLERPDVQRHPLPESGRSGRPIINLANYLVRWTCEAHPLAAIRESAFRLQVIEPTAPDDPQPNPLDAECRIKFEVFSGPREEVTEVAKRAGRFVAQAPDWTVGILVRTNETGYRIAEQLRAAEVPHVEYLQNTSTSRQVAQVLGAILAYLAQPLSGTALWHAYEQVATVRPDLRPDLSPNLRYLLKDNCRRPEALIFPTPGTDPALSLPQVARFKPEDYEFALAWADCLRPWLLARQLPIDELVLTLAQDLFSEAQLATAQKIAQFLRRLADQEPTWTLPELAAALQDVDNQSRFAGLSQEEYGFSPTPGVISLTTLHKAKGLEWDLVYLVGVDDYWYPHTLESWPRPSALLLGEEPEVVVRAELLREEKASSLTATERARLANLAESLRLLYVGITRARRYLCLSSSRPAEIFTILKHWSETESPVR
ncbi:MAG: ATP-dependent helicase [Gloeomargaritaceae cyanobacterium C42_A2020_066]|nr:ATP-dependent helicase [Gloeomargaritaceae cyanobacterium C42_A2020_066]